ncbi:TRAP transporter small permease subunit [Hyphococcus lacteus]|uniref:TRAP transporter small permease protein n=1 Tax=Hyphococcus lacteus TaxID=3143536 RepID=A0ABV3Z5E9_9PROT
MILMGGVIDFVGRLTPLIEKFVRKTGHTVMWLLIIMALIQFGIVVLRYVFGINKIYMQESITYMHGTVFLLAGGYALLTNDHVRVDIFYGEASEKRKALIDFLGTYFLLFPVCLLLLWTASPYVGNSWAVNEGSPQSSGIQGIYLLKSLIPMFALLMIMAGFTIATRAANVLRGRE